MDVIKVVEKLENLGVLRTSRILDHYYSIYCPFHKGGQERKASCGILLHDEMKNGRLLKAGFCHCFTCGYAKDFLTFMQDLLKIRNISQSAQEWLAENIEGFAAEDFEYLIPHELFESVQNKFAIDYLNVKLQNKKQEYVTEEELARYRYIVPYMYERKLTDEIIEKFDVGFDANWKLSDNHQPTPCITFPVRDRYGNTLFLCRRAIKSKFYNYPKEVEKPLYGIDQITPDMKSVCVCESCIDALTLWGWGYPSVALMGTGNPLQIKQLKELGIRNYVICTDGDDAGRRAVTKFKKSLSSIALVWALNMPDGKDVNDLTKEEFDKLYEYRE